MKGTRFFLLALFLILLASVVFAAIPQKVNYQGKLTDSSETPLTGDYTFVFKIYDADSGGNELWSETRTVSVYKGAYNVVLGEDTPISAEVFDGSERWLGVKVEDDSEMTPRLKIVSVGNTYRAADSDNLGGMSSSDYVLAAGDTMTGPLTVEGTVTSTGILATADLGLEFENWNNAWPFKYNDSLQGGNVHHTGLYFDTTGHAQWRYQDIPAWDIYVVDRSVKNYGNLTIGSGEAATNYSLKFDGESGDGSVYWMESEDHFRFDKGVSVEGNSYFTGDVTIEGTLRGGSPVKVAGGVTVEGTMWASGLITGVQAYAQLISSATQTIASATTAQAITFEVGGEMLSNMTHTTASRLRADVPGTYFFNVSAIASLVTGTNNQLDIWFRKNGADIPSSNTLVVVTGTSKQTLAVMAYITMAAGDYVEVMMAGSTTNVRIEAVGTQSNPTRPACPSIILTVMRVSK